ncbi:MAG: DUF2061 domain-containing protein [Verrucomicrobia bacterium]|nr:DUF2061 domain-containing protein [Verrucomicrobiota bacterium]MDC0305303.1 DUF2061 domain-containing protein [bacterium]MDC0306470.1 DUF2061 domain-containing protein [Akkermansiaceae bacterium]
MVDIVIILGEDAPLPPMKNEGHIKESKVRSALKGVSWRIIATLTIIAIVYVKTGEIQSALEIGAIEFVIKYLLYFAHERAWAQIPFGSVRKIAKG